MPTNDNEARQIFTIINEFIDVDTARKIMTRLHEEVGKKQIMNLWLLVWKC